MSASDLRRQKHDVQWNSVLKEITGREVTVGEVRVHTFFFLNEKKFCLQLQQLSKLQVQWEQ